MRLQTLAQGPLYQAFQSHPSDPKEDGYEDRFDLSAIGDGILGAVPGWGTWANLQDAIGLGIIGSQRASDFALAGAVANGFGTAALILGCATGEVSALVAGGLLLAGSG